MNLQISVSFGGFELEIKSLLNKKDLASFSLYTSYWRFINEEEIKKGDEGKKELVRSLICNSETNIKQLKKEFSDIADILVILSNVDN